MPLPTAHSIEVVNFTPAAQLDSILCARAYYTEPEPAGLRAYALLRDALERSGRVAIARVAHRVIEAGRKSSGRRDIRCTVSIGGFVPKPHTPCQWAAQCDHETVDARLKALGASIRADRGCWG